MLGCQRMRISRALASATGRWPRCHGYSLSWRFPCRSASAWRYATPQQTLVWSRKPRVLFRTRKGCRVLRWACLSARMSVYTYVRLSTRLSQKLQVLINRALLPVAVARFYCDGNRGIAIDYLLPVLWMTSWLHVMARHRRREKGVCLITTRQGQHRGRSPMSTIALYFLPRNCLFGRESRNLPGYYRCLVSLIVVKTLLCFFLFFNKSICFKMFYSSMF